MDFYKEDEKVTKPETPVEEVYDPLRYNMPECLADFLSDKPELIKKGLAGIAFYSKSKRIDQNFFQEDFYKQLNAIFRENNDTLLLIQLFTFLADCSSDSATFYRLCYKYRVHESIFEFVESKRVQIPISIIIPIIENFLANITRIFNQVFPNYIYSFLFNYSNTCNSADLEIITRSIASQFISKRFSPGDHIELIQQILQFFTDTFRNDENKKLWAASLYILLYSIITRFEGLKEEIEFPADLTEIFIFATSKLFEMSQYIKDVYFQSMCIEDSEIYIFIREIFGDFLNTFAEQLQVMLENETNFSDLEWLVITTLFSNVISIECNADNAINTEELEKIISEFAAETKRTITTDFQNYAGTLLIIDDGIMENSGAGILASSEFMDIFMNNFCINLQFNAKMAFISWLPDIMMHQPARNLFSEKYGDFILDEIAPTIQLNNDDTNAYSSANFISFIIQHILVCSEIDASVGDLEKSNVVGGIIQRLEDNSLTDDIEDLINDENKILSFCSFYLNQLLQKFQEK